MTDIELLRSRENVLAVVHNRGWVFYAGPIDLWVLDWDAWKQGFVDAGYGGAEWDASERGGVSVFNGSQVDVALAALNKRQVGERELVEWLRAERPIQCWEQVAHLFPVVLIDVDTRRLVSMYAESLVLERYVPSGWQGESGNILEMIPSKHRYWIDGRENYLSQAGVR